MVNLKTSFDDGVSQFRRFCVAKGLSGRTVETYMYALSRLRLFMESSQSPLALPTRSQLRAFAATMLDMGLSKSTVRVRMGSIRAFTSFLVAEGLLADNPMDGVPIPRVPAHYPRVLSDGEIVRLLRAARTGTWYGVRNHAIVATFCDTGLRLSELIDLDLADVSIASATISVRNGKGGKSRYVYMGRALSRSLRRWLEIRPSRSPHHALFCTRDSMRLDKRNVARIIERIAQRAGFQDRRVHPHLLRHSFATLFIRNGGSPFALQRLLGHSDISTTAIYVNLAGTDLEQQQLSASPLDRLQ